MNDVIKKALKVIDKMEREWYGSPKVYTIGKGKFECRSYQKWSLDEIRRHLRTYPNIPPVTSLEMLRSLIGNAATVSKSKDARFIFSIYYDVITHVIDVLLY